MKKTDKPHSILVLECTIVSSRAHKTDYQQTDKAWLPIGFSANKELLTNHTETQALSVCR